MKAFLFPLYRKLVCNMKDTVTKDICEIEDCTKPKRRNKTPYCPMHAGRFYRHGDPTISKLNNTHRGHKGCIIEGCPNKHCSKGLCKKHYHEKYTTSEEGKTREKKSQHKYNQTLKGKIANRLKRQRRRHLEKSHVKLTTSDILQIYETFEHKCFNCGDIKDLTLDHHIALNNGGKLSLQNTVLLCRLCNGRKADLSPNDFYSKNQLLKLNQVLRLPN